MNAETYAEWHRRQGHRVIRTESSYWVDQGPRAYQSIPQHWIIQPTELELQQLLREEKAAVLRYSTPIDAPCGKVSYHMVFEEGPYDLNSLSSNARSKVRRGLKRCVVEPISMERLATEGWRLQRDTLDRQGRSDSMTQEQWHQVCVAAKDLPGFEAWAALVQGELAATILVGQIDDTCHMLYPQSHRQYFDSYANNAVSYMVSREMLSRPDVRMVFYGEQSLDAPASVDEFKRRMGHMEKPVRQRVVFRSRLDPLINHVNDH